jgi:endonuclease III
MTIERVKAKPLEVRRVHRLIARAAGLPDVRAEVEANHDENRWWPTSISDPRVRMLAAGWSTRVSYRMVETYARVITSADARGFDSLVAATDAELAALVRPIGLPQTRIDYLRSLAELLRGWEKEGTDPTAESADCDALVLDFAARVRGASYKVAQCALLTARGYHCGIIPVDSGMVTKLAPALGIALPSGAVAHERLRHVLEAAAHARSAEFRSLVTNNEYRVTIPDGVEPTWWVHLVLIYFKRLYLNGPAPQLCRRRPVCTKVVDCAHRTRRA